MTRETPIVVCDLGYGDGGKGTTVDALARRFGPSTVVRYNGGPQALHFAVAPDGTTHGFAQIGAGSLGDDSRTVLSGDMLVDLDRLAVEVDVLTAKVGYDVWSRLTVDPNCLLVTPMQVAAGRLREIARGAGSHGSCGLGVGETVFDDEAGLSLRVRDLANAVFAVQRLDAILDAKRAAFGSFPDFDTEMLYYRYRQTLGRVSVENAVDAIRRSALEDRTLLFEGAQGALLDRRRGFVPHVTKTDTSRTNAFAQLWSAGIRRAYTLGVLRAYGHRHGAGPFVTEDASVRDRFDDPRNAANRWQGAFRVGWLDLPAVRFGIRINAGLDGLSLTGLDRLSGLERIRVCVAYRAPDGRRLADIPDDIDAAERTALVASCTPEYVELPGWDEDITEARRLEDFPANARAFVRFLESDDVLATPVVMISVGPRTDQKILRNL